eukprot:s7135_g1.t1
MDNVAFLITVAVVYASVIWVLPVPIVFNWKHLFHGAPSHSSTDATVQARLQEHKKNWPDWIPVFTRSGEAYFVLWSMLRLGIPGAWTKPTYEDLHLWSLLTVLIAFRWSCGYAEADRAPQWRGLCWYFVVYWRSLVWTCCICSVLSIEVGTCKSQSVFPGGDERPCQGDPVVRDK